MTAADVFNGERSWSIEQADCIQWAGTLPDDSIDLFLCSPPYEAQRTYSIGFNLRGQDWVDWMMRVVKAFAPKVKGLMVVVCEGYTKNFQYSASPLLLAADLHRAGFCLRKPPVFVRIGVPGSGGKLADHADNGGSAEWLRNDYEFCLCITRGGRLPWADALAFGHTPKWAPGGEMSYRQTDGTRVNQWGHGGDGPTCKSRKPDGSLNSDERPSHQIVDPWGKRGRGNNLGGRKKNGEKLKGTLAGRDKWGSTGHDSSGEGRSANGKHKTRKKKGVFRHSEDPTSPTDHDRLLDLAIANPGNVINELYTSEQVAELLAQSSDVQRHLVGGGQMGHDLAHENEAPFPLTLATFFVRSFCPPGGITADCFGGSFTTAHASIENDRRFVGCDLRQSQVDLGIKRLMGVTPALPGMVG